jgi:hypothetical protein
VNSDSSREIISAFYFFFFFFFFFLVTTANIIKLSDRNHITLSITKQPHNIRVNKGQ